MGRQLFCFPLASTMSKVLLSILLAATAAPLLAQTCPERNLGVALGAGDEAVYTHAIGFAFPFAGTTYTDVHVCTNGFLFLSNGGVPTPGGSDYTATQAEFANGSPRICALWCDLNLIAANGAQIYANNTASTCTIT